MSSPTQRTLKLLRKEGCICDIAEHYNSFTHRRKDLFGFADIIALNPASVSTIAVQTTSGSNVSARLKKIKTECKESAAAWLACGNDIAVIGWRKKKVKRGGKAKRWQPVIREIKAEDLD